MGVDKRTRGVRSREIERKGVERSALFFVIFFRERGMEAGNFGARNVNLGLEEAMEGEF